jgi:hypothetical protein
MGAGPILLANSKSSNFNGFQSGIHAGLLWRFPAHIGDARRYSMLLCKMI